ncbi:MAG: DNA-directed RNA polymerase subunit beta' [bacterium]
MAKDKKNKKKEKSPLIEPKATPLNLSELLKSKDEPGKVKEVDFNAIKITIASPEIIRQWSHGEVKKPETINYRTFKPEFDGLFCEKIFGPTKDYECACGKYKKQRYKGVTCDKCGVEVTESKVRRERMGNIELAVSVVHIWYLKGIPSKLAYLLGISARSLERVIYYENYIVIDPGTATDVKKYELLNEDDYIRLKEKYPDALNVKIGADAIKALLREKDIEKLAKDLRKELVKTVSLQKKKDIVKRLKVVEAFRKSGNKPEWMILDVIPVIPPELRPLVQLDGGRFVTSDLNDLYRRIINRNNRLKKLISINSPELIIKNEKRMIQEAIDALFDNGRRGHPVRGARNRPLKSLSDMLKGKQGRFRQNLLGKRVDYSGRSVVVVGPSLKLYQCGLPKKIALELFKPFIINKVQETGHTIKSAKKMVENVRPEVWDILEEILIDHVVLLNRAPTLHRHSIQGFEPILVEGNAITLHPLVCGGFNADFDGDQLAVHVPLSFEAQTEAKLLMLAPLNILSPASGKPIIVPNQDIVLGIYYLNKEEAVKPKKKMLFFSIEEAVIAFDHEAIKLHTAIDVKMKTKKVETTVGRIIFNKILPEGMEFVNEKMDKKQIGKLVGVIFERYGSKIAAEVLDKMKEIGFKHATLAGFTIGLNDLLIPKEKEEIVYRTDKETLSIRKRYDDGIITEGERYNAIIDKWTTATDKVADFMIKELEQDQAGFNPVWMMVDSGARGSKLQIRQLAGMRGLMAKPQKKMTGGVGEIIETPIKSNFREGLTVLEYFISTHGARKGLADTALKTADAGYLTRRLIDVAQDVIITEQDCLTINGISVMAIKEGDEIIEPLSDRIMWRVALDNVVDLVTDDVVVKSNELITPVIAKKIEDMGHERIRVRSVLTCEAKSGVCSKCYGADLTTGKLVELGEAVGIIAAQSIGEPGTQLTLRTFHVGGTASRVVGESELEAKHDGIARFINIKFVKNENEDMIVTSRNGEVSIFDEKNVERESRPILYGTILKVKDGAIVKKATPTEKGTVIGLWDMYNNPIFTEKGGKIQFDDIIEDVTMREESDPTAGTLGMFIVESRDKRKHPHISILADNGDVLVSYSIPVGARLEVKDKQRAKIGTVLAKFPKELSKTRDVTGGLPRVAELFEARKPKNPAIISEIQGKVSFEETSSGARKIMIKNDNGTEREYQIPHGKYVNVRDGDEVENGEQLVNGNVSPHDILSVQGENAVQEHLLNMVQEVYRLQGVTIHDKHIEVMVRQMMKKVRVDDPGDSKYLMDEQVDRFEFVKENEKMDKEKKTPAKAKPILLGITKAALSTDSWVSAASFQETTRVLIDAAVNGKVDMLKGLKENVIIGHLISAGTGVAEFAKFKKVERKKVKRSKKELAEENAEEKETDETETEIKEE